MKFCILNARREHPTYVMPKFILPLLLEAIHRYKITYLYLVPPIAVLLIKSALVSQYDISSIKFILCGAAPLGNETSMQLEKLLQANNTVVRQGWGTSEATCSAMLFAPDEYDPKHLGVRYLCAYMEAKVVSDDGKSLVMARKEKLLFVVPTSSKAIFGTRRPRASRGLKMVGLRLGIMLWCNLMACFQWLIGRRSESPKDCALAKVLTSRP